MRVYPNEIVGRYEEVKRLSELFKSGRAEFLAVYGRRRVGKTFLINQFFRPRCRVFELTGIKRMGASIQLSNFATELEDVFSIASEKLSSWSEAFNALRRALDEDRSEERIVIFLDELPWLATQRSGCLEALSHFWNRYASRDPRVILVVCGSSTSWMLKKVVGDRGGLHGRLTVRMRLMPFTLIETEAFLDRLEVRLDRKQIVELFMVFGGVPTYLEQSGPGRSSAQIIDEACFGPSGYMRDEFRDLYAALFDRSETHLKIIRALAQKLKGLDTGSLSAETKIAYGGSLTSALTELEESGFVGRVTPWGHLKKGTRFRLSDEFSLFYLRWMEKVRTANRSIGPDYWLKKQMLPTWHSWSGFAFEGVCLKHVPEIKQALGISGVHTEVTGWATQKNEEKPGAQIDLVVDRADSCINLFEIKFYRGPFQMTQDYARELVRKRDRFTDDTGTKKSVFVTMLTPYGAEENKHYRSVVNNQLTLDDLFGGKRHDPAFS